MFNNIWRGIGQLVSLKKKDSVRSNKLIKDDQEITDHQKIANEWMNYFVTTGSKLAAEIPNCGTCIHTQLTAVP